VPADKVVTPAEINSQFDSISYSKGGACLRMLQQYITPVDFQHGLHQYLLMHEFGNAVPEDLWAAFGQTPKSLPYAVDTVMEAWTRQPGYPLVKIERTGPTTLSITQVLLLCVEITLLIYHRLRPRLASVPRNRHRCFFKLL
jgi:aminopeptidase N